MCLLLDHGLRIGEVAGLHVAHFDLNTGTLTFYRSKVDKTQTHQLTADTLRAAMKALRGREPGPVFGCVVRTLQLRVRTLGAGVGLERLSPHDCRHAWATFATRAGTAVRDLQEAGGWSSPAMPLRYAEATAVANQGVKLR
jgi:integrase